jgi:hypothetical protein
MTKAVWGRAVRVAIAAVALGSVSCGELTREGQSTAYLVVQSLEGARGDATSEFSGVLASDVESVVDGQSTIFADVGRATFVLRLKDPGSPTAPNTASPNNAITVNRYRVTYVRSDGRNTPGVDVPYGFDGAVTLTVSGEATAEFTLVRVTAKQEAPLAALRFSPVFIDTIAEVTFYGRDQTGREASAVGRISVNFGNYGG